MYIDDPKNLYACFRCGSLCPDVRTDVGDMPVCGECGENGLVYIQQALDIVNDVYLKGLLPHFEDDYDYEIELDEES